MRLKELQDSFLENILESHKEFTVALNGNQQKELVSAREKALLRFKETGFPTTKDEEWKYTNLRSVLLNDFRPSLSPEGVKSSADKFLIPNLEVNSIVVRNGFYDEKASEIKDDGLIVTSLAGLKDNALVAEHLHSPENAIHSLVDLNTAFLKEGLFIRVKENSQLKYPVHIIYQNDQTGDKPLIQPRNIFVVEKNASCEIIEDYHSATESLLNSVGEAFVEKNAILKHYRFQFDRADSYQVNTFFVNQERDSNYTNFTLSMGGAFIRNDLRARVKGENSQTNLYGIYQLYKKQFVDNHTVVDHMVPHCESNELYKGVLDDTSVGVFNGKVFVRPDAQKINAFQSNRNILLSDNATINTKPQLEIWADDVKCSHGATSGQLNDEELFYLRARGISRENAKSLLIFAFAYEVVALIKNEALREYARERLAKRLAIDDHLSGE